MIPTIPVLRRPQRTSQIADFIPLDSMSPLLAGALLNNPSTASPHPETGGECITPHYLATLGCEDCKWAFRFTSQELSHLLELPDPLITKQGYHASALESLHSSVLICAAQTLSGLWCPNTTARRPLSQK
ncbi:hypothetical protein K439DRAFT_1554654 [Ramaria rubella]|nr:hypothetical protein K439DRAFT_1554654 [Ramaria rubella]